jgi:N6-L-threonylcarbamoyladenine synthase
LAERGRDGPVTLPRPMLDSGDLAMSFSGLKTAVLMLVRKHEAVGALDAQARADIAREFQAAVVDVLVAKSIAALAASGHARLVVAGGVGANRALRARLTERVTARGGGVYFPAMEFCTDNGAMIALAGALRLVHEQRGEAPAFSVLPRWELASLQVPRDAVVAS